MRENLDRGGIALGGITGFQAIVAGKSGWLSMVSLKSLVSVSSRVVDYFQQHQNFLRKNLGKPRIKPGAADYEGQYDNH